MVAISAGVFLCGLMISYSGIVATSFGMVELRKRKNKRGDDDDSVAPATSSQSGDAAVSDDDVEEEPKSKSKRKMEDVVTKTKGSAEGSVSHSCRFCSEVFAQSQALGGHMNKHRSEKRMEAVLKAQDLIAKSQPYIVSNPWNFPSSLQNPQMNQQNVCFAIQPSQGGDSYNYNRADNTRSQVYVLPTNKTTSPVGQYQAQHEVGGNSGQQYPATPTIHFDSKQVLHGGRHIGQVQYGSQLHANQDGLQDMNIASNSQHGLQEVNIASNSQHGLHDVNIASNSQHGLQDVNIASNSQQGQMNIPVAPFMRYQPSDERMTVFVDQHGNLVPDFQGGHNFQTPQGYNQSPLDQRPNMGSLISSGSSGIGSEHNQPRQGVYGMSSVDAGQEFQGGIDHHEDTALKESGQAGFETDASIDDHILARVP